MIRKLLGALLRRGKHLVPSGGTEEQTVKSGVWMGAMNALNRGLALLTIIVLANLLSPADFGLLGIALLTLSALKKFLKLGLNAALIQDKATNIDEYLDTAWGLQVGRGIAIAAILVVAAPLVADLFSEPRATDVLRVIAISPVLLAFRNPGVVYFQKNLNFHREFLYRTSGSIVRFCVSLGYAFIEPTVWALVVGFVSADLARLVASYSIHDYRPGLGFRIGFARELIGYGKWITGSSILVFLYTEGDDAIVGWLLGTAPLAFYQNAYRLSNAPATEVSQVIAQVMFPAFSTLQESTEALRQAYFRVLQITLLISFPVAFGIAAVAPVFVTTFMGEEWLPMVRPLQILSIYGALRALGKTTGPLFRAVGRPDYETKLALLRAVLILGLIVPVTEFYGTVGAAVVVVGVSLLPMTPVTVYLLLGVIDGSVRRFSMEMAYPLVASVLMFGSVTAVGRYLPVSGVLKFVVLVLTGICTYVLCVVVLSLQFDWDVEGNVRSTVGALLG